MVETLEETMILYGTYSANNIDQIVDFINHLHKDVLKHEKILHGGRSIGIKTILERRIAHVVLNSLLYFHELQKKYVNPCENSVRKLYSYMDSVWIISGY